MSVVDHHFHRFHWQQTAQTAMALLNPATLKTLWTSVMDMATAGEIWRGSMFLCSCVCLCVYVCVCVLQSDIYSVSMVNIRTKLMCYWIFHETLSCFVCFSFSFLIQEWSLVAGLLFFGVFFWLGKKNVSLVYNCIIVFPQKDFPHKKFKSLSTWKVRHSRFTQQNILFLIFLYIQSNIYVK